MKTFEDTVEIGLALDKVVNYFDRNLQEHWGCGEAEKKQIEDLLYMLSGDAILLLRKIILALPSFLKDYRFEDIFCFPFAEINKIGEFKQSVREERFSTVDEEFVAKHREYDLNKREEIEAIEIRRKNFNEFGKKYIVPKLKSILSDSGIPRNISITTKQNIEIELFKAAKFCYKETQKKKNIGKKRLIEICRGYLVKYSIKDRPNYTAEQLSNYCLKSKDKF